MDSLEGLLNKVAAPFVFPLLPQQRIYFLYLAAALGLALVVFLVERASRRGGSPGGSPGGSSGGSSGGFLTFCFPKAIYRHRSALVDYKYFFVNSVSFAVLFAPLMVGSEMASRWAQWLLGAVQAQPDPGVTAGVGVAVAFTVLTVIAFDLAIFIVHYLQHKVPLLWEFHKIHHSAEVLTPMTVYRMHPVDDLLAGSMVGVFTGSVHGLFGFFYADGVGAITVLEVNAAIFVFYLAGYNLRHSHIWLAYPRALSHVFVSPAQHQIHHSKDARHFDKNLGFIFAFWDGLAGTLYVPEGRERLDFGLDGDEHREFDSVWKLYSLPFRKLFARARASERIAS